MNNNLGKIISDLRNKKGITQKELADAVHASDKAVSRWETGASLPTLETIHLLSKYFNVSFKALLQARVSTENSDELVNDIMKEFDEDDKKKKKIIRKILLLSFISILTLFSVMIFTNTYNKFKVYKVMTKSSDFYEINGMYVETRIKDSLFLNDIKLKNYEPKASDSVIVDVYYIKNNKKYILDSFSRLRNIQLVNYSNSINNLSEVFDELYLDVNIVCKNGKEYNYKTKLDFIIDFSNNKLYEDRDGYNAPIVNNTVEEITNILLKNGFKIKNKIHLEKRIDGYLISYYVLSNKFKINFESNNMYYHLLYEIKNNYLEVIVTDDNNIEIEDYKFDVNSNKILYCRAGNCNNYNETVEILNNKILNLLNKE